MGAKGSKSEGAQPLKLFSEEEQKNLHAKFSSFAKGESCKIADLKQEWNPYLESDLLERFMKHLSMSSSGDSSSIDFQRYASLGSVMLRGLMDEQVPVMWSVAADDDILTTEEMVKYVRSMCESYLRCIASTPPFSSWHHAQPTASSRESFSVFLLHDLIFKGKQQKETLHSEYGVANFSRDDVEKWFVRCPLLATLQGVVFQHLYSMLGSQDSLLPLCKGVPSSPSPSILDVTNVIFLNNALPTELRGEWRFLFSTREHGESFSKLLGRITEQGPTIIIVVEKNNQIFGGFASQSWTQGPKFGGSSDCFLFNLAPKMAIYPTTSYNSHYMYLNTGQQTLPNGLGMGGQFEYFGLWLDNDFGKGRCSPTCTTYQSAQLATRQDFQFQHLEVWGVGPEPKKDENERVKKSVLDSNLEDQAILSMAGKATVSVKEDRITEDDE